MPTTPPRTTLSVTDNVGPFAPQIGDNPQYGAPGDDAGAHRFGIRLWPSTTLSADGNFSAHSAPGYGVLRDRVAPEGGGGLISIRCCEPKLETPRSADTTIPGPITQNPEEIHFEFCRHRAVPKNPGELVLAEFWLYNPRTETEQLIAIEPFPADPLERLDVRASALRGDYDGPWEVRCACHPKRWQGPRTSSRTPSRAPYCASSTATEYIATPGLPPAASFAAKPGLRRA